MHPLLTKIFFGLATVTTVFYLISVFSWSGGISQPPIGLLPFGVLGVPAILILAADYWLLKKSKKVIALLLSVALMCAQLYLMYEFQRPSMQLQGKLTMSILLSV